MPRQTITQGENDMRAVLAGLLTILVAAMVFVAGSARADDYPSRPVQMIVPYPPGASTDITARIMAEQMSEILGRPFVVENRPGADGVVGMTFVAHANPDGYTLLLTVNSPVTMAKFFQKDITIDPRTALVPVVNIASTSLFLAVNAQFPANNVRELIDYAKAHPGQVSFGSAGVGSAHQIAGELINLKAGIHMEHVPYRGGGPAIQDLVAGHIPVSFGTGPAVMPQAKAGAIRILAAVEAQRDPQFPDVPTIAETLPGVVTATWLGLFAPAGTPPEVTAKLNKAANEALKRPGVADKMKAQGLRQNGGTPDEFKQLVASEYASFEKLIPELGIKPQ
jgi:tripartite-type tricarboxylate transporter receptor subunit TctC